MIYTTYDYYKNDFGGVSLPESDFPSAAAQASQYLDVITQGRISSCTCSNAVQNACCAMAEAAYRYDKAAAKIAETGSKASETVGSYSVTYRSVDSLVGASESKETEMKNAARLYLAGTGLLYRGLCL